MNDLPFTFLKCRKSTKINFYSLRAYCILFIIICPFLHGCRESRPEIYSSTIPEANYSEPLIQTSNVSYNLGYGDVMSMQVLYHPEYDLEITIPPEERISIPRIGSFSVQDKSIEMIRREITQLLSKSLKKPDVTINIAKFSPQRILVLGEVNNPGVYPYEKDASVLSGLAAAGGLKNSGARESIVIIPKGAEPYTFSFNYKTMSSYVPLLHPGDLILVPPKQIHSIDVFVDQFFSRTNPVLQYYLNILDIGNYDDVVRTR